ncbi:transposase (plasmid) [Rhizobium grahamii CCGE 502]|uniref:Transposase n=1 Tax=Rhizobium grahamii CCGE 502 TaxID=990285 RepID=S3H4A7_9HYPH|nr:transposase [Rhizobium grahamii CCGE 502]
MVGDRADAMLEVMDEDMHEARHEGKYRRIEVITGRRRGGIGPTKRRRGSLPKAQNPT